MIIYYLIFQTQSNKKRVFWGIYHVFGKIKVKLGPFFSIRDGRHSRLKLCIYIYVSDKVRVYITFFFLVKKKKASKGLFTSFPGEGPCLLNIQGRVKGKGFERC